MRLLVSGPAETLDVEVLWRELHDRLIGFIARRIPTPEDAEDILQDVMLRIHQHHRDLEHTDRVAGWVYRIASNAIADHYRKPARRELPAGHATDVPDHNGSSGQPAWTEPTTAELRSELAECLAPLSESLPGIYREALHLTEFEGLSQTQAAARVGISVSGMKTRVQRAREQLKDRLLGCCQIDLDSRGGVIAYRTRPGCCDVCGRDHA